MVSVGAKKLTVNTSSTTTVSAICRGLGEV